MTNKISKKPLLLALLFFIPFAVFSIIGIIKLRSRFSEALPTRSVPVSVRTITTSLGNVTRYVSAVATLKSAASIDLKAETNGRITSLTRREGDLIKSGELLAVIDPRISVAQANAGGAKVDSIARQIAAARLQVKSLESQKKSALAAFEFASRELERNEHLFVAGAVSASAIENSRMVHSDTRAKLEAIEAQIAAQKSQTAALVSQSASAGSEHKIMQIRREYSEVRAPADSIISMRLQEEGNLVAPGALIYRLEETGSKKLVINIAEKTGAQIRVGQKVQAHSDGKAHSFVISRIYPTVNRFRQVTVEAESEDANPRGPFEKQVKAHIEISSASGTVIPAAASFVNFSDPETIVIFEVTENTAIRRIVRPVLTGTNGDAVVAPETLNAGTILAVGSYLQNTRLPASFSVEVMR